MRGKTDRKADGGDKGTAYRKALKYVRGLLFLLACLLTHQGGMGSVRAEGTSAEIREEGRIIVRKGTGDLEQLEAIRISGETPPEWRAEESAQGPARNAARGAANPAVPEILSCGSAYAYEDMARRPNPDVRREAYRQMESICRDFSANGKDAAGGAFLGETYWLAGSVELGGGGMSPKEAAETYFMFRQDNPQYFWLSSQVLYRTDPSGAAVELMALTYDEYRDGAHRSETLDEIAETARAAYLSKIGAGDGAYQKALKLHDTLIAEISYAYGQMDAPASHSIAGALTSVRSAVCEGYAKTMQLLMNYYKIENIYVTGDAGGPHAWNMARMPDGRYYWLDATWDDQDDEQYRHSYFLVGGGSFTDHQAYGPDGEGSDYQYPLPAVPAWDYAYDPQGGGATVGDINGDGSIGTVDLMLCLYHTSKRSLLTGERLTAADIDGDGKVGTTDLMRLLYYVSKRSQRL